MAEPTQVELNAFILRAGFRAGWENLESWARRMAEQAVREINEARAMHAAQPAVAQQPGAWVPLPGTLPDPGKPVLLDIGEKYPIRAMWAAKHTIEVGMEDDSKLGEYDEATDTYYCPEGWYEWNEQEERHWLVDKTPVAWCELPTKTGTAQPAPQQAQEPVAWYVTGCGRLLDEDEAKAEARHIGGTARAIPLYTAPQADSQPAVQQGYATRAAARALSDRFAEMCNVDKEDHWQDHSDDVLSDAELVVSTYLAARAPADSVTAPAAGAVAGPSEPTPAMYQAAQMILLPTGDDDGGSIMLNTSQVRTLWQAMLAVAPTPPAQAADSVLEDAGGADWQDISTAPKDGTRFVAVGQNYGLDSEAQHTCIAQRLAGCWVEVSDWNGASELKYLTHWMPLPPLPCSAARKQVCCASLSSP